MARKTIVSCLLMILLSPVLFSQVYTNTYYMDENFGTVAENKAVIIGKGYSDTSGFVLDCFSADKNVLLLSAHFTDNTLAVLDGFFRQYYDGVHLQTEGIYRHSEKHGLWTEWNKDGIKTDSAGYENGIRLRYAQYIYYKSKENKLDRLYSYSYSDTLANTLYKKYFSDSGTVYGTAYFIGDTGVWTQYTDAGEVIDTVYSRLEKEATFPGGNKNWARHLEKYLSGFNPADHGARNGIWKVIVSFIVSEDGTISNVQAETDFGHKMEETAIMVIKNSPPWEPATRFGKVVKAYRRQPVTFVVESH